MERDLLHKRNQASHYSATEGGIFSKAELKESHYFFNFLIYLHILLTQRTKFRRVIVFPKWRTFPLFTVFTIRYDAN